MSKLTDELRTVGIYNEHLFFDDGGDRVWIGYSPGTSGRGGRSPVWQVYRVRGGQKVNTDPGGHWMDYGRKTFPVYGRNERALKLEDAKDWAGGMFGIADWARSPFGGWGDADFIRGRLKALRAAAASRDSEVTDG